MPDTSPNDAPAGAPPRARGRAAAGRAVHHALVLASLAAALAGAGYALRRGLQNRVGLEALLGGWTWLVLAVLALGVGAALLALGVRARAWRSGRWSASSLAPLRGLFSALALGWIAYVALLQPFQRLYFDLALGAALSCFAVGLVLRGPSAPAPGRGLRALDFAVFQLCLACVVFEVGLRTYAAVRPSPLLTRTDRGAEALIREHRIEPGTMHLGFPHNRLGFYDEEFGPRRPGVRRVVAISDSYGFGIVPHPYHYTTVAEQLCAGVEVLNMGVPAVGPPEYLHLLNTEVRALAPDLIVICLFLGNDVGFAGHDEVRLDPGLRSWFEREKLLVVTALERRATLAAERTRLAADGGPIAGVWGGAAGKERIEEPAALAAAFPWIEDPLLETPGMSAEAFLTTERARARDVCHYGPGFYEPFFRCMAEIVRAAGATPLAVLLIPDEMQVEDAVWQAVVASFPGLELERDRPQRWIGAWLAERGIPAEDLLPRLRALEPLADGRRHAYHLRDTHFNRRGCRAAGEGLAELIRRAL